MIGLNIGLHIAGAGGSPYTLEAPLTNSIPSSMTFSRASSQYYIDASGVLRSVTNNIPAFEPAGLLLEGSGTNKCTCYGVPRVDSLGANLVDTLNTAVEWFVGGANTIVNDVGEVKFTYVNNTLGGYTTFRAAKGLSADLVVGAQYKVSGMVRVSAGSTITISIAKALAASPMSQVVTSVTNVPFTFYFMATSTTGDYIQVSSMAAGEIAWVSGITVQLITDPTAIFSGYAGGAFDQNIPNMTLSGDVAAVLSIVTDQTELVAAKLDGLTNGYKVYKLDNSLGSTAANLDIAGGMSVATHSMSVIARYGAGANNLLRDSGSANPATISTATYSKIVSANFTAVSGRTVRLSSPAAGIIFFIIPQLEEQPYATSIMPSVGASATRASTVVTLPTANNVPTSGVRHFSYIFTPKGTAVGKKQTIMVGYTDANNFLECFYNGVIFCFEKRTAGVSEYVTFPATVTLNAGYLVDCFIYADNTLGLFVNGVSAGSGLGSDVALYGDFSDATKWTADAGCTVNNASDGKAVATNVTTKYIYRTASGLTARKVYSGTVTIESLTGNMNLYMGSTFTADTLISTTGTKTLCVVGTSAGTAVGLFGTVNASFVADNFTVKEVLNNSTTLAVVIGSTLQLGNNTAAATPMQGNLRSLKIGGV